MKKLFVVATTVTLLLTGCKGPDASSSPVVSSTDSSVVSSSPVVVTPGVPSYETVVTPTGTKTGHLEADGKFYADYSSMAEVAEAGHEIAVQVAEEGDALLKNDGALPLSEKERKITLFGVNSDAIFTGGGGSGSGSLGANGITHVTYEQGFIDAGFKVNPKTMGIYKDTTATLEPDISVYSPAVVNTYKSYNDAAVILLSRTGQEFSDPPLHDVPGHSNPDDHYLQFQDNEIDLIKHVKAHFDKIIVVLNTSNTIEIGGLMAPVSSELGVNAVLWVGMTGNDGAAAIGRIIAGAVNPSGHTSDIWPVNLKQDPTWFNFGDNSQIKDGSGNRLNTNYYLADGETLAKGAAPGGAYSGNGGFEDLEYREGIYMGYRYYETKATLLGSAGEAWYASQVAAPFGHGLSYTTFDWTLHSGIDPTGLIDNARGTVTLKVDVTNTGDVAGKDVVQLYSELPYTTGGIEKASRNLVGFAKTGLLQPGETETVTVQIVAQDLASFDYNDLNNNSHKGYELEAGDYILHASRSSHDSVLTITRTVQTTINIDTDYTSGNVIKPLFSDGRYNTVNDNLAEKGMTRANGLTLPGTPSIAERIMSEEELARRSSEASFTSSMDKTTDPWYASAVPATWNQLETRTAGTQSPILLSEMSGVSYVPPKLENGTVTLTNTVDNNKWETFMNQLTASELKDLVGRGSFSTYAVAGIGKETAVDNDGPMQLKARSGGAVGTLWPVLPIQSATFDTELATRIGNTIGNESLFIKVTGWYGPGVNTHRSAFGGRNFEYYSQDGVHAGLIAAAVIGAATEKGLNSYMKHVVLNDQETDRYNTDTWLTEQALREIYTRPLEYAIKVGNCSGFMTAFNRIGDQSASVNYALLNSLLRHEWGFQGEGVTDMYSTGFRDVDQMIRTGNNMPLGTSLPEGTWSPASKTMLVRAQGAAPTDPETVPSPTHYYNLRKSAQEILYVYANNNSMLQGIKNNLTFEATVRKGTINNSVVDVSSLGSTDVRITPTTAGAALLPAGVTFNSGTDAFVAAANSAAPVGVYNIPVDIVIDGWVKRSGVVTLNVIEPVTYAGTDLSSVVQGSSITGQFASTYFVLGGQFIPSGTAFVDITGVRYLLQSLPAGLTGLTITESGALSGIPSGAPGTYTLTVRVAVSYLRTNMGTTSTATTNIDRPFTVVIV
ncbi:MAG: glycoside hydrolase family 3 C-terminal domain-containing protein [Bacillales bacterium]|jgi:beta-glucosidase|nr:glycoside hydrolase family 3 C-terminal domain-containing protein [Bacillales bacterium]